MELLAPAGNLECLKAAVQCGANAVYFSGKAFGARSFADNFDLNEIEEAVEYCHLRNVKTHVTVNTLVTDRELEELGKYIELLSKIGVDAVIVQDLGAINVIRQVSPDLIIHGSTQMTVHNLEGVLQLKELGIKRAVLSRELSFDNIKYITQNTDVEIEVFAHGAQCMSYSGQCLMSSILGGRSGNRGKCAQPCRLPYSINNSDKKFFLSLKDMYTLNHLDKLKSANVTSLKIEGRMKGVSYVATVISAYRKYIDSGLKPTKEDINNLNEVFYRGGLTDGYLTGKIGPGMFAFDKPDNPYKKDNGEVSNKFLKDYNKAENIKLDICCMVNIIRDEYPVIRLSFGDINVEYRQDEKVQKALKSPTSRENVMEQIRKTGSTPFNIKKLDVVISKDAYIPLKSLNELRRAGLDLLKGKILDRFRQNNTSLYKFYKKNIYNDLDYRYNCSVQNIRQFNTIKDFDFYRIYVPVNIINENIEALSEYKDKIVIVLPVVIHDNRFDYYMNILENLYGIGFKNLRADNIFGLKFSDKFNLYGGYRLNIFNSESIEFLNRHKFNIISLSPELNIYQIRDLNKCGMEEVSVYGRLPLMLTENCIVKNSGECPCADENYLTDRKNIKFPIIKDCGECRSIVLNSKPTFMADKIDDVISAGVKYFSLDFTTEQPDECIKICKACFNKTKIRDFDYTRAHFNKGVT